MLKFQLLRTLIAGAAVGFLTLSAVDAGTTAHQNPANANAANASSCNSAACASAHCSESCGAQCEQTCGESCSSAQNVNVQESPAGSANVQEFDVIKISETFGHLIGRHLEAPGFTFDVEAIIRGIRNGVAGQTAPMTEEEYDKAITLVQERAFDDIAAKNLQEANAFMQINAQNGDIIQVEPGKLQYRVLQTGAGVQVAPGNAPLVHYTGKYINGTVFGTSVGSDPISLPLDQTIPGFSKGLVGMQEGEKRVLYIHPELAYGTSGSLPPNSLLVFEVEIIKADSREAAQAPETAQSPSP